MERANIYHRLMIFFGLITVTTAAVIGVFFGEHCSYYIPYSNKFIPIIHILCTIGTIIMLIKPSLLPLQAFILEIESIVCCMSNFGEIGLILFTVLVVTLYLNLFFDKNTKLKIFLMFTIWVIQDLITFPFGTVRFFMLTSLSTFFCFFMIYFYSKIEIKKGTVKFYDSKRHKNLPPPGSDLYINNFDLTDRQIKLLQKFLSGIENYNQLKEEIRYSLSTVKREMTIICQKFGTANIIELKHLLSQYKIIF